MIKYSTFENLNELLKVKAPSLNNIVLSFNVPVPRLDYPHFDMLNEKRGIKSSWHPKSWWPLIETGQKVTPEEFFDGFVPGWNDMNGDFMIITMDSYSTGRIYQLNAKDFLELHNDYDKHSGNYRKSFQGPGDYIAIDLNAMKGYALMHEGYASVFDLE